MAVTGLTFRFSTILIFSLVLLIFLQKNVSGNISNPVATPHRRFEYKYSFKPPYLAQKDGTVPFWEYGGNAIASSENVRVAPSLRSQKGGIWTKQKTNFDWWQVEIVFRVTGRGRIGADGLAFWFTQDIGDYNGPVFGSSDKWKGLGLFFDSFDNDNQHNNPYIMAVLNDGTKAFDHQNDGTTQLLSGCLRDFRNKPHPTRARIEYYNNVLTVLFHNGMSNNNEEYEICFRADGVQLPKTGYFGLTAATGGLADDHDVFHFLTTSLHPPGQLPEGKKIDDSEKLSQEYQEYQQKLDKQKLEYKKEHPEDRHHNKEEEWEEYYESDNQRELRQIFQGQTQMTDTLRDLSKKMDEVIGRQEHTMGLITQRGGTPPQAGAALPAGSAPVGSTISRLEVELLIKNQNILLTNVREMRQLIGEVHSRTDTIITNQGRAPTAQIQSTGYDMQAIVTEMRDGLNHVKQGMAHVGQKLAQPQGQVGCPNTACVGVTMFLGVTACQLLLMFIYNLYKNRSEAQAKKFY